MRKIERKREMKNIEEEKNRNNRAVEIRRKVVGKTGAEAKIEKIKRLGKRTGEGREMLWVRFTSVEKKIRVMKKKRNLRDRRE